MKDEWAQRAQSFGQVADLYDRWRPGYPDEVYADVLALSPGRRVLEAGAGTGRATVQLARRGARVVAVEPDAQMAAVARERTLGMSVQVEESTFEAFTATAGEFDLVVAAQAWHWVDGRRGTAVAARALRSGGALCLWWNRPRELSGPAWDAIGDAYAEQAPTLDRRDQIREQEAMLEPAPGFTPWSRHSYDWSVTYDAESYTGLVQTHSDHVCLPTAQRQRLLEAIRHAITRVGGGQLEYQYRTLLAHARVK